MSTRTPTGVEDSLPYSLSRQATSPEPIMKTPAITATCVTIVRVTADRGSGNLTRSKNPLIIVSRQIASPATSTNVPASRTAWPTAVRAANGRDDVECRGKDISRDREIGQRRM